MKKLLIIFFIAVLSFSCKSKTKRILVEKKHCVVVNVQYFPIGSIHTLQTDAEFYGYETGYLNIVDFFQKILHQINSEFSQQINKYKISTITFSKNSIIITKQTDEEIEIDKREYRFIYNL
jgi:hypothetical protein